jgi:hypothetical protein
MLSDLAVREEKSALEAANSLRRRQRRLQRSTSSGSGGDGGVQQQQQQQRLPVVLSAGAAPLQWIPDYHRRNGIRSKTDIAAGEEVKDAG